ncbi:hypothetical protein K2Z84_08250 [Candidatus Binatia bacterium]|nr:hypothetical protein [Candidatus Binatia bacterium]
MAAPIGDARRRIACGVVATALARGLGIPPDRGGHGIPIDVLSREVEAAGFTKVLVDEDWPTGLLTDL